MTYFLIIIFIIICVFLFLFWFERSNIYFPGKILTALPDLIGLSYKDVYFRALDGTQLHG